MARRELIEEPLSEAVIGAAIEVHREVGPGLLESAYEVCLAREFELRGVPFVRQLEIPVEYKSVKLDAGYRLDFLIDGKLIVEIKAVEKVLPVHEAQLLTYLRLLKCRVGLLINFHAPVLKDGIRRRVL